MTDQRSWGQMPDGRPVFLITLTLPDGVEAAFTNLGAIWVSMQVPAPQGQWADVVLGFDKLADYLQPQPHLGAVVGRVGNRIAQGQFSLEGKAYQVARNLPPHHLHGGEEGFSRKLWTLDEVKDGAEPSVSFSLHSPDGDQQYPGNLHITVRYTLTQDHAIRIEYSGQTDAPTLVNLTHHAYFNLDGQGDILDHELTLYADYITENDETVIPTGQFLAVDATPFDFTLPARIGERLMGDHPQLTIGQGFDQNFVIRDWNGDLRLCAEVFSPRSGRRMFIETTEPGVQFYTANHLRDLTGKNNWTYTPRCSFCLEAQHFPDAIHHPHFPAIVLLPGETYRQTTVYRFG